MKILSAEEQNTLAAAASKDDESYGTLMEQMWFIFLREKGKALRRLQPEDGDDSCMDAFLEAFNTCVKNYRKGRTKFRTYFTKSLKRNISRRIVREEKRQRRSLNLDGIPDSQQPVDEAIIEYSNEDLLQYIEKHLTSRHRKVVELRFAYGYSHRETAKQMRCSGTTVHNLQESVKRLLKNHREEK